MGWGIIKAIRDHRDHDREASDYLDDAVDTLRRVNRLLQRLERDQPAPAPTTTDRAFLLALENRIMDEIEKIRASVAANTSATNSAAEVIKRIADRIRNMPAPADLSALKGLADELDANSGVLSKAVTDNTDADGDGDPTN